MNKWHMPLANDRTDRSDDLTRVPASGDSGSSRHDRVSYERFVNPSKLLVNVSKALLKASHNLKLFGA